MIKTFLVVLFVFFTSIFAHAQKAKYQVDIIYRLSQHFTWPETAEDQKFVIGVVCSAADFDSFKKHAMSKKVFQDHPIEVRRYDCNGPIEPCDLLYISNEFKNEMKLILEQTKDLPTLIISDQEGFGRMGSVINFVDKNGKLKFELNQDQANRRGLQVSEKLKNIAIII